MFYLRTDESLLAAMRFELDRYRTGRLILSGLVHALELSLLSLSDCRPELTERMRAQLAVIEDINTIALGNGELVARPEHNQVLDDVLRAFERLLEQAIAEAPLGRKGTHTFCNTAIPGSDPSFC